MGKDKKNIIQVKLTGPSAAGNGWIAKSIAEHFEKEKGFKKISPASSYDPDDSYHLENDETIIQIRTRQTTIL